MLQFQGVPTVPAIASHSRQAAQIIQDLMDLLREWLVLLGS